MTKVRVVLALSALLVLAASEGWSKPGANVRRQPHNVIIFVADGLRSQIVTPQTAPALAALRAEGADFRNSHSLYPTLTTPNASAIATGHYLGDTGDFANMLYVGLPHLGPPQDTVTAAVENDAVLRQINGRFAGDYLNEESLLAAARAQGFSTATIGKLGPTWIQDLSDASGLKAVVVDDSTGRPEAGGVPLASDLAAAIAAAGLPLVAPTRGDNGLPGSFEKPGTHSADIEQIAWFADVTTKVLLPRFKAAKRPFAMVFWSRDPDGSQHNQGDSLNSLRPGINGPTSMAGIRNASDTLQKLRDALKAQGLDKTTDVIVTADHGFATISRQSQTSPAARIAYADTVPGLLPTGFLGVDLSLALDMPLWSSRREPVSPQKGQHPPGGGIISGALLGPDPEHPQIVVAVNGGSDMLNFNVADPAALARRLAPILMAQDYTAAVFVDDALGSIPGTLPMSRLNLVGSALTPRPQMIVSFRSYADDCARPETCVIVVVDGELQQGQGSHGSFSRAETHNFMAAVGPDFKKGFVDPAPVSNADLAWTAAKAIGIKLHPKGRLTGRVIAEAFKGGKVPAFQARTLRSDKAQDGFETVLDYQQVGDTLYFDAAGMPGRVFGLKP